MRSHSDNFLTRLLEGYWINQEYYPPPCEIVSLYLEQIHPADGSRKRSMAYGFRIYPTIAEALTLGSGKLAVDGVLLIGEHGDYPTNEKGWKLHPRHEFFQQVVKVFRDPGRSAPVFVDKRLSYDWSKAKWMYDQPRQLKFPLMAGSSASVTFRRLELDFPLGTEFEDARETGIRAVYWTEGDAVWRAAYGSRKLRSA